MVSGSCFIWGGRGKGLASCISTCEEVGWRGLALYLLVISYTELEMDRSYRFDLPATIMVNINRLLASPGISLSFASGFVIFRTTQQVWKPACKREVPSSLELMVKHTPCLQCTNRAWPRPHIWKRFGLKFLGGFRFVIWGYPEK